MCLYCGAAGGGRRKARYFWLHMLPCVIAIVKGAYNYRIETNHFVGGRGGRRSKNYEKLFFNRWSVRFEIYVVQSPTNALFINLVKFFKFTFKYKIISLLHISVFNGHHKGALSVPN